MHAFTWRHNFSITFIIKSNVESKRSCTTCLSLKRITFYRLVSDAKIDVNLEHDIVIILT